MSFSSIQPHFSLSVEGAESKPIKKVTDFIESQPESFEGQFTSEHALFSFHKKKRHFWTPWLHLEVRKNETEEFLYGWFTPHPSVWTGFVFSYLVVGCLSTLFLIIGFSQQILKATAWGYAGLPVMLLIGVALWIASKVGQRLAQEEMQSLKEVVQDCFR